MSRHAGALAVGLLVAVAPVAAAAQGFRVHQPAPNSIVSGGGVVHLVVEVDPGIAPGALRARLNGTDLGPAPGRTRPSGGSVVHWAVQLRPGSNTAEVELAGPGGAGASQTRHLYYHSVIHAAVDAPKGFRQAPFHQAGAAGLCIECHRLESLPSDVGPPTPEQSSCYPCHARLTRAKEVHGPAALWACTRCHDPTASPRPYATPEPVLPLCFGCHQEQKDRFTAGPYQHGPTATGFCTICHNPHGSDEGFFLKKAAYDLCLNCHSEKTGRHVISWGPQGQGHPLRGRPDPNHANRELSCASCHNPHAAAGPKLWNFGATHWLDLCRNCHQRILGG